MAKTIRGIGASDSIFTSSLVVFYHGSRTSQMSLTPKRTAAFESPLDEGPSSQDLIRDFVDTRHFVWVRWFESELNARYDAAPGLGLELIADVLRDWCDGSPLRCSAVINATVLDANIGRRTPEIASSPKDQLRRAVELFAAKTGLHCPDVAASAALLIIERTIAMILATGDLSELKTAKLLFECLQQALTAGFN